MPTKLLVHHNKSGMNMSNSIKACIKRESSEIDFMDITVVKMNKSGEA